MPTSTDGPTLTQCHLLDTGYCTASEHHLIQGGQRKRVVVHSVAALLQHPTHGWLLWDAGYAPRLLDATRRLPFRLYRWVTPMHVRPELAVVAQLGRFGLEPRDVAPRRRLALPRRSRRRAARLPHRRPHRPPLGV